MKALKLLLPISLIAFAGLAHADDTYIYKFTTTENSTVEDFYCKIVNADDADKVKAQNYAELIRGFQKDSGKLESTVSEINTVAFQAKHDPNWKYTKQKGKVTFTLYSNHSDARIESCQPGANGRPYMQGEFGVSNNVNN